MCDVFPEVENCCGVASIRVGMIFIAVLSISTGAVTLGVMEQRTNMNFDTIMGTYRNVSVYTQPKQALSDMSNLITTTVTFIAVVFMFSGLVLLFSTLADQEGFAQAFVMLMFLNIIVGIILIGAIVFECVWQESKCFLGDMDWLSSSASLVAMVCYLIVWFYFCCVANSYVVNAYT